MQNAEAFRLFIAIPLPEPVKDEIERAQTELRRALPDDCVRWTKRGQFHLTLRFLGDVDAARLDALKAALQLACGAFPAIRLQAERIGFFPHLRFPKVIWAWVHDEPGLLAKLQAAIEAAAREFTHEAVEQTFTGHVTLGRSQRIKRPQAEILAALAHGMTERRFGEWTAENVELIRSELLPGGPRYTVLAAAALESGRLDAS